MECKMETITPGIAKFYLGRTIGNRKESEIYIARYAEDMKQGRWIANGNAISFDDDGNLLDGHHRLYACIKAGVPFQSLVVRGIAKQSVTTADLGKNRCVEDILNFSGVVLKNARYVSSAMRILLAAEKSRKLGEIWSEMHLDSQTAVSQYIMSHFDEAEILANLCTDIKMKGLASMGVAIVLASRAGYDAHFINDFFVRAIKGIMLANGSPEFALHNVIYRKKQAGGQGRLEYAYLCCRAFNLFTKKKTAYALQFDYNPQHILKID